MCDTCVNNKSKCRSMSVRPKEKWCHMTAEQAIKAEKDILRYISNHGGSNVSHFKAAAVRRIAELER